MTTFENQRTRLLGSAQQSQELLLQAREQCTSSLRLFALAQDSALPANDLVQCSAQVWALHERIEARLEATTRAVAALECAADWDDLEQVCRSLGQVPGADGRTGQAPQRTRPAASLH